MNSISWREFLRHAASVLSAAGIDEPLQEVRYLTSSLLDISLSQLITRQDQQMPLEQYYMMMESIKLRSEHVPAAYIVGQCGFYGREFLIGQGVLIPRPDTETLIEQVLNRSSSLPEKVRILDTFTGSGCIGITLALELGAIGHEVDLDLVDISNDALAYVRKNIDLHGLADISKIRQADIWPDVDQKWHLISANPPYICSDVITGLQLEVRENEPLLALDGGLDGLHFYREIFRSAEDKLLPDGVLACEHGYDQAAAIKQIAESYGWNNIYQYNDLGGNPRVTICDKM